MEKCPYGKDFRETCLIVKDKLGCVNLFYDETKYINIFRKKSKNIIIAFDQKINDCYKIKLSSHTINLSMSVSKYDFVKDVKKVLKNLLLP